MKCKPILQIRLYCFFLFVSRRVNRFMMIIERKQEGFPVAGNIIVSKNTLGVDLSDGKHSLLLQPGTPDFFTPVPQNKITGV